MGRFSEALRLLRERAGFPTAYAFYHRNGGRRAFPFTYAYYTQVERGKSLPRGEWLPLLLSLLRLPPDPAARREVLEAYLRDLVGKDEVFDDAFAPLLRPAQAPGNPGRAVTRLLGRQSRHITPAEMGVILASRASYSCFVMLTSTSRPQALASLARRAGLSLERARAALGTLQTAKLAASKKDLWSSPLADDFVVLPRNYRGYKKDLARLRGYWNEMAAERGGDLFDYGVVAQMPAAVAVEASAAFQRAIEAAAAQHADEREAAAPVFLLQARVRRVLPG